jgi:hypothetical protein
VRETKRSYFPVTSTFIIFSTWFYSVLVQKFAFPSLRQPSVEAEAEDSDGYQEVILPRDLYFHTFLHLVLQCISSKVCHSLRQPSVETEAEDSKGD